MKNGFFRCRKYSFSLSEKTLVMGVLNVTPDSFSDGGKYLEPNRALERAFEMIAQGADIIDVGGESTRPGAPKISAKEEIERVLPVLKLLNKKLPAPVSLDTYKYEVAKEGLEEGIAIINDISGLRFSPAIAGLTAKCKAGLILMHIKGTPENMQADPYYRDVVKEIKDYLKKSAGVALAAGNKKDRILLDPGIGFGKTVEHNLKILKNIGEFVKLGYPILIGASRKSFIGKILKTEANDRLSGSLAAAVLAVLNGAAIVRVHDVKETVKALKLIDAVKRV